MATKKEKKEKSFLEKIEESSSRAIQKRKAKQEEMIIRKKQQQEDELRRVISYLPDKIRAAAIAGVEQFFVITGISSTDKKNPETWATGECTITRLEKESIGALTKWARELGLTTSIIPARYPTRRTDIRDGVKSVVALFWGSGEVASIIKNRKRISFSDLDEFVEWQKNCPR